MVKPRGGREAVGCLGGGGADNLWKKRMSNSTKGFYMVDYNNKNRYEMMCVRERGDDGEREIEGVTHDMG